MLVGHDKVIVRIRFRWSASRSRDGTFNRTASLIEVTRLRGEVVHAPSIRGSCLLTEEIYTGYNTGGWSHVPGG